MATILDEIQEKLRTMERARQRRLQADNQTTTSPATKATTTRVLTADDSNTFENLQKSKQHHHQRQQQQQQHRPTMPICDPFANDPFYNNSNHHHQQHHHHHHLHSDWNPVQEMETAALAAADPAADYLNFSEIIKLRSEVQQLEARKKNNNTNNDNELNATGYNNNYCYNSRYDECDYNGLRGEGGAAGVGGLGGGGRGGGGGEVDASAVIFEDIPPEILGMIDGLIENGQDIKQHFGTIDEMAFKRKLIQSLAVDKEQESDTDSGHGTIQTEDGSLSSQTLHEGEPPHKPGDPISPCEETLPAAAAAAATTTILQPPTQPTKGPALVTFPSPATNHYAKGANANSNRGALKKGPVKPAYALLDKIPGTFLSQSCIDLSQVSPKRRVTFADEIGKSIPTTATATTAATATAATTAATTTHRSDDFDGNEKRNSSKSTLDLRTEKGRESTNKSRPFKVFKFLNFKQSNSSKESETKTKNETEKRSKKKKKMMKKKTKKEEEEEEEEKNKTFVAPDVIPASVDVDFDDFSSDEDLPLEEEEEQEQEEEKYGNKETDNREQTYEELFDSSTTSKSPSEKQDGDALRVLRSFPDDSRGQVVESAKIGSGSDTFGGRHRGSVDSNVQRQRTQPSRLSTPDIPLHEIPRKSHSNPLKALKGKLRKLRIKSEDRKYKMNGKMAASMADMKREMDEAIMNSDDEIFPSAPRVDRKSDRQPVGSYYVPVVFPKKSQPEKKKEDSTPNGKLPDGKMSDKMANSISSLEYGGRAQLQKLVTFLDSNGRKSSVDQALGVKVPQMIDEPKYSTVKSKKQIESFSIFKEEENRQNNKSSTNLSEKISSYPCLTYLNHSDVNQLQSEGRGKDAPDDGGGSPMAKPSDAARAMKNQTTAKAKSQPEVADSSGKPNALKSCLKKTPTREEPGDACTIEIAMKCYNATQDPGFKRATAYCDKLSRSIWSHPRSNSLLQEQQQQQQRPTTTTSNSYGDFSTSVQRLKNLCLELVKSGKGMLIASTKTRVELNKMVAQSLQTLGDFSLELRRLCELDEGQAHSESLLGQFHSVVGLFKLTIDASQRLMTDAADEINGRMNDLIVLANDLAKELSRLLKTITSASKPPSLKF